MFTQNDFKILQSIVDKDDETKGVAKANGTTKKEIMDKTKLSSTKVTNTLLTFESIGLIEQGLKVGNSKSYILTDLGAEELFKLKGVSKTDEVEGEMRNE